MLDSDIIQHTKNWIKSVVIDLNFCPFAAKVFIKGSIRYTVIREDISVIQCLSKVLDEFDYLTNHPEIETSFIVFSDSFSDFDQYLTMVKKTEKALIKANYEGVYQLASFHPNYCFADADEDDPANYTNRSIYPMLHLLREESLSKALSLYNSPELIPEHNIKLARQKGLQYMQMLRLACVTP